MKDRLFQLLGIEHGEESMVSMLLTQSVFLGIFYGAFDISAHSLFLAIFDEKMMAKAYVVSGFAGIILTGLYTWLQARLHFKNFATANLIFITVITFLLWLALILFPSNWIKFLVFVMLGPLNILAMLGFWGTTGRLFTLRQGKRLFGLVDAGLVIGIIVSCYAIPVLLSFKFDSHNILLISIACILIAAVIQIMIGRNFTFAAARSEKKEAKKNGLSIFREDSYIRIMGIFIALSVMTAFFVQYSFMAITRAQYPLEEDMARFLGLFTGSMMIFTLLIKILAFSYIIRNYGLKTCLAITPVIVGGFTLIAVAIGTFMGFGPASSGFILFFLLLALSRLFSKSLKDSIESPSFKVIYQTVDEKIRYEVQSGIDGTINEISALSSGLLLAGLGAISFVKLIHFSWVLAILITIWIFVAIRLYLEYRGSIKKSLEAVPSGDSGTENEFRWNTLKNRVAGIALFKSDYYKLATGDLSIIENSENKWLPSQIIDFAESHRDPNLVPALRKIASKPDLDEALRHRAAAVLDIVEAEKGDAVLSAGLSSHFREEEKLFIARKALAGSRLPQTTEILRLLRDNNTESKRYAIYMIGKFRLKDMISEVCDCLLIPGLETDSFIVLSSFGEEAHQELFHLYLSSSGNVNISKTVIRLISRSATKENTDFLFARLWSNSRQIKEIAAESLIKCGFRANDEEKDKLNQLVSDIIGMITWNISAQSCLAKANNGILLGVIKNETTSWNSFLFNILSIAYDSGSVAKIRANIESGTVESVNYALEMVDIVIGDSIKPKLVALIDVVPDDEKLKNLHHFYPGEVPEYGQLIEEIINRDYNLISIWAKACTIRNMNSSGSRDTEESLIALLFSPEKILQEESAKLIGRTNKKLFDNVFERLLPDSALYLKKIVSGEVPDHDLLFEKVSFLSSLFKDIQEDELLYLAGKMTGFTDLSAVKGIADGNNILWNLVPDLSEIRVFSLYGEELSAHTDDYLKNSEAFFYLLHMNLLEDFQNIFPERSFEIYRYIDLNDLNSKSGQ